MYYKMVLCNFLF